MLAAHVPLLNTQLASGTPVTWPGGQGIFSAVGTFGGATVKLQFVGPDGTTFIDAGAATTLTAPGGGVFYLHPCQIQGVIVGGAPSGIIAAADRVPF